jgi:hypothetical protein
MKLIYLKKTKANLKQYSIQILNTCSQELISTMTKKLCLKNKTKKIISTILLKKDHN